MSRGAGDLVHRFAFDERADADRGDGVSEGEWEERFQVRAGVTHIRGGEAVLASRLEGQHVQVVYVRSSSQSRSVSTSWRLRDVRTGDIFNIRDITPTQDRQWIDFLCQSGVNPG